MVEKEENEEQRSKLTGVTMQWKKQTSPRGFKLLRFGGVCYGNITLPILTNSLYLLHLGCCSGILLLLFPYSSYK